ncbi:hypothetical protein FOA43_003275 [Brettanomyces nanus]|uniref:Monopolin complex subunit Csm1/Pcs1 C-terminal domain-containing protein n=1 Tax=Eeniella nana TaxID=13502 RepID=A0A875S869_EENNA|nr:uncharacterized protein FOA43_003275 [Brettanomyces nanus]QPG75889.1 hypothetical protein FOA43_003275 [Brettanomyces nanus]
MPRRKGSKKKSATTGRKRITRSSKKVVEEKSPKAEEEAKVEGIDKGEDMSNKEPTKPIEEPKEAIEEPEGPKEPIKEPFKEPIKNQVNEPINAPTVEPTMESTKEPTRRSINNLLSESKKHEHPHDNDNDNPETPTKKRQINRLSMGHAHLPTEASVSQLFQRRDMKELTNLSQSLMRKSEKTFQDYKKLAEKRAKSAESIISKLSSENSILRNRIKDMRSESRPHNEVEQLKKRIETLKKTEMNKNEEMEKLRTRKEEVEAQLEEALKEFDLFDSKQEIIELLSGASCVAYEENQKSIIFRLRQTGEICTLFYELVISKSGLGELVYIPLLEKPKEWEETEEIDWETNLVNSRKVLPEYLMDNLTFPSNTLRNFYTKIARSVSKGRI